MSATLPHRLRERLLLERDLRGFGRRFSPLLSTDPPADGPPALIVSLSDFVYQLKLEGMFAKALELRGLQPVFLVPEGSAFARRVLGLFGFDRFVELHEFTDEALEAEARRETARLLEGGLTFERLRELTFHGAAVGVQAVATVSRALHEGTVDFGDARVRALIEQIVPDTVCTTLTAERLFDRLAPEIVLFNERNYAAHAPLSDVALGRGINVVQFVFGFQDDAFVFKRYTAATRRLHPRSLSDSAWERVKAMPWTPELDGELDEEFRLRYSNVWAMSRRQQGWTHDISPQEVLERLGLDPAKRTAVLFSHVLWDANMFYGEDLFPDQERWFVESVRAACANNRVNWIVKLHPANLWKLRRDGSDGELAEVTAIRNEIGPLPPHVALLHPESEISARSVFDIAHWGLTIRGTVGIELPCVGTPVLTAGTGYYSGRGFTVDSATADEYLARVCAIEEIPPLTPEQIELARRHAFAIFRLRRARFTSFRSTFSDLEGVASRLDPNLVPTVRSRAELESAEDLRRLAAWMVDSREPDYLTDP